MDINRLREVRDKLIKFGNLRKKRKFYLTMEEKQERLRQGKRVSLRVKGNGREFKSLVKTRGTIVSGDLKDKKMGL